MSQSDVLFALENYFHTAIDDDERVHILGTIDFIQRTPLAFDRYNPSKGHVGSTAIVVTPLLDHILLTRHTILNDWAFFGNHADSQTDLLAIARARIAKDTSPSVAAACISHPSIFDVDIHYVPPHIRRGETVPAHLHYDIAYLFRAPLDTPDIGTNSQWFSLAETLSWSSKDQQFKRITKKIHDLYIQSRQSCKNPLSLEPS